VITEATLYSKGAIMMGKSKAKADMLKHLSKEMSNDSNEGLKDVLGKKNGVKKVTVASDSAEGLQKGLSMAEKLMELKGQKSSKKESPIGDMSDMMEEADEEESSAPSDADEQVASMSDEEAQEMYEALKKRCE
jgi:hypothetical protein